ncbi:MAG: 6-phospho-beta-glucosidase [Deltaproteobacteria bacterium]|nr:6-phospho-beta-glucosidase [Deltaproteobacteria bacterium]
MKITIIGGGSTYTPELVKGLIDNRDAFGLEELALQDIRPERQEAVASFCRRLMEKEKASFSLTTATDRKTALNRADFVIIQIRVGGQEARNRDIRIGLDNSLIGQETTGIGGFAKALRTLPKVLEICSDVVQYCPNAWVINFTNPSGLITEGIIKATGVQTIGLCNIPYTFKKELAGVFSVEPRDIELDYVGLNHLSWVRKVMVHGKDRLPELLEMADSSSDILPEELDYPVAFLKILKAIPSGYLRYYYDTSRLLAELKSSPKTRAQTVMEIEKELFEKYNDPGVIEIPEALSKRGGAGYSEAALGLIDSLVNNKREIHVVNVQNNNSIQGLPEDSVVEIPCLVNSYGAHPLDAGDVNPHQLALMQHVKAYELLTVQAVMEGSREKALLALITNPLGPEASKALTILDDIIKSNQLDFLH